MSTWKDKRKGYWGRNMRHDDRDPATGFIYGVILGIIIWLLIAWAAYGIYSYLNPPKCRGGVVSDEIKARMRYHGVEVIFEDWKGNHYFIRNGKRCPL